jgi:hypothetical protein
MPVAMKEVCMNIDRMFQALDEAEIPIDIVEI